MDGVVTVDSSKCGPAMMAVAESFTFSPQLVSGWDVFVTFGMRKNNHSLFTGGFSQRNTLCWVVRNGRLSVKGNAKSDIKQTAHLNSRIITIIADGNVRLGGVVA